LAGVFRPIWPDSGLPRGVGGIVRARGRPFRAGVDTAPGAPAYSAGSKLENRNHAFRRSEEDVGILLGMALSGSPKGQKRMPLVKVKENESIDKAIKRFKKKCEKEGIIQDIKKSSRYLKPSEKKRKKQLKAEKRRRTGRN
jgi:small subunit ribosomal protein S21